MFIELMKKIVFLLIVITFSMKSYSQNYQKNEDVVENGIQDAMVVGISGIGGALLGLSTLSFEKDPENHLGHILVGGAIGIIVGVGIVLWNQASKGGMDYDSQQNYPRTSLNGLNYSSELSQQRLAKSADVPVFFIPALIKSF